MTPASLPLGGVPLGGIPLGTPSPALSGAEKELLVLVNIYKAEGELHHVDVRRRDGPQWQFYLFYSDFRRAMSEKLGMGDYSQLSMYSPLIGRDRRQVPAARRARPPSASAPAAVSAPTRPSRRRASSGGARRRRRREPALSMSYFLLVDDAVT